MKNPSVRSRLIAASLATLLVLPPAVAFAGPEEAAEYYKQASEAYESGEYARAADLLERAYAEDPNLIYQYNRVLALQALGRYDEALKLLDLYENPMMEDGRFNDIKEIRAEIEQAKAEQEAEAAAATVGPKAATAGGVDPDAAAGSLDDPAVTVTKTEPAGDEPNYLGWSLVGGGALLMGTGALFGSGLLLGDVADRRDCLETSSRAECYGEFSDPQQQYNDDKDTWETHQTLTLVFLGVGAATAIGGGVVLFLDDGGDDAQATRLELTPYATGDGGGGAVRLDF